MVYLKTPSSAIKKILQANRTVLFISLQLFMVIFQTYGSTVTYFEDPSDFPNPERGFWGGTVKKQYIDIGNWKTTDLPQSFLDGLDKMFNDARNSNIKLVVRFKYTNGGGGDASLDKMLTHMEQLRPVLQRNFDVITVLEAGFVGGYAEWWGSTSVNTTEARRTVLFKLLDVMPKDRMVAIRYNNFKRAIYDSNLPLTAAEAFDGSNRARTSAHNDCFITNEHDAGTYKTKNDDPKWGLGYEQEKDYLSADNLYLSQDGETCDLGPTSYASCDRALTDMKRMRWDMINNTFNQNVLNQWKSQGCYEEISRRLGYRIRLLDAAFDDEVTDGDLDLTLHLTNEGFGKIYNPRKLEMVLRNTLSGMEYVLPMSPDPRLWSPGLEQTLHIKLPIPKSVAFGTYSLFLNLPDPAPRLYGKPQYSIRLANKDLWQQTSGYNALNTTVKISSFNPNPIRKNEPFLKGGQFASWSVSKNLSRGSVGFDLTLARTAPVNIDIQDLAGNRVCELAKGMRSPGSYAVLWNGLDQSGRAVPEGVYLATFRSEEILESKRIYLLK